MIRGKARLHDHDLGLQHDLGAFLNRRRALALVASATAIGALSDLGRGRIFPTAQAEAIAKASDGRECLLDPTETEGPFPGDGSNNPRGTLANVLKSSGIVRRDMRTNIAKTAIAAEGQAFDLEITLVNVRQACAPLAGHAIYLWHCDALGRYSIYDLPNASYLRAVGVTDSVGNAVFTTIFPGCYPGRYPHIHFEVYMSLERATSYKNRLLTSQMAMPADACRTIYAASKRYGASATNFTSVRVERDDVFADSTPRQIAAQTPMVTGGASGAYKGVLTIGISA
jgi:protocatechuate 3,4-dioxygenase beta subunit